MNKFWRIALSSFAIVVLWWGALAVFARYQVSRYGVTPTFPYYNSLLSYTDPSMAVWGHFDGAHYLKLASVGYVDQGTQAFFPVYPLLINFFHEFGLSYFVSGLLISLVSLVFSLICIHYLFPKQAWKIIAVLLVFPTSFYLGAIYTESFFLLLTLLFFLSLRSKQYLLSALLAAVASGTRLVGSLLAISLLVEIYPLLKQRKILALLIPLSLTGLFSYMYFLNLRFGDPLIFIHVQSMFGASRSGGEIISLPQVLYRYLNILLTVSPFQFLFQRAALELMALVAGTILLFRSWRLRNLSTSIYLIFSLILPTLSGTLSSLPRYLLVLIPWLLNTGDRISFRNILLGITLTVMLFILLSIFASGQFVA